MKRAHRILKAPQKTITIQTLNREDLKEYLTYLSSPKLIFWSNFWPGTSRGLGFVLGTVVIIAVVMFIISQVLAEIPWIGELFRWLDDWMRENLETYGQSL